MRFLREIANNRQPGSLADRLRQRRYHLFLSLLNYLPKPASILDLGGTERYWAMMDPFIEKREISVTLANVRAVSTRLKNFKSVMGDAASLPQLADKSFDVVFSNSVIEHLTDFESQQKMASEARRIGKAFFVQTPNRHFPMEPHFLFPFFQYLPLGLRIWIASHWKVGWYSRVGDPVAAAREVKAIRLLTLKEMKVLFPGAQIYRERFCGLTKSIVAYDGFAEVLSKNPTSISKGTIPPAAIKQSSV